MGLIAVLPMSLILTILQGLISFLTIFLLRYYSLVLVLVGLVPFSASFYYSRAPYILIFTTAVQSTAVVKISVYVSVCLSCHLWLLIVQKGDNLAGVLTFANTPTRKALGTSSILFYSSNPLFICYKNKY